MRSATVDALLTVVVVERPDGRELCAELADFRKDDIERRYGASRIARTLAA